MFDPNVNLDKVLDEIGPFGRYQCWLFSLIIGPIVSTAMHNAQYVFNAADLNYRCLVPECETLPAQWLSGPWETWALKPDSPCERRAPKNPASVPSGTSCTANAFYNWTIRCDRWVYEKHSSIVAEFNLACQEWKRTLVGTMHSLGVFTALIGVGVLSDRCGRRTAFVTTAWAGATMGVSRSFVNSYIVYITLEYLEAVLSAGVYSTGLVLALEMIGLNRRVQTGCFLSCVYALGRVLLAELAWAFPYWRTLTRVLYIPSFAYFFYYFLIDESIRWLFAKDRNKDAVKTLKKIAAKNGKVLKESTVRHLEEHGVALVSDRSHRRRSSIVTAVLHSRCIIFRALICAFCWCTITFVYYGLSINSVSLDGNMYLNYVLTSVAEIPGYMLSMYTLNRFGRKLSIMGALLVCSASLVILPFMPNRIPQIKVGLTLIGKTAVSLALFSIVILAIEMFPTSARHCLVNICSTIARFGAITAPLSPLLLTISPYMPFLLFGILSGAASVLLIWIPETLNNPLPDTLAQAEYVTTGMTAFAPTPTVPPPPAPPPTEESGSTPNPRIESGSSPNPRFEAGSSSNQRVEAGSSSNPRVDR